MIKLWCDLLEFFLAIREMPEETEPPTEDVNSDGEVIYYIESAHVDEDSHLESVYYKEKDDSQKNRKCVFM